MKVLDASAVLVLLNGEAGASAALREIEDGPCVISAVNYAEVLSKMVEWGVGIDDVVALRNSLRLSVVDATADLALSAALLRDATRKLGLSLADRFCLALAQSLDSAVVVTADRAWKAVKGFRFAFVR